MRFTVCRTDTVTLRTVGSARDSERPVEANASILINGLLDYDFGPVRMTLELPNVFGNQGDDIRYFYSSRLQGEPAAGVDDCHFHPVEPRTVRVSLRIPLR